MQAVLSKALAVSLLFCVAISHAADEAPDPACAVCKGAGIIPNSPNKPYIRVNSQPPEASIPPAWKFCDKCQKSKDVKAISSEMKECQERARVKHKDVVETSGLKLDLIMTPYVSIHTNASPAVATKIAEALEKCTALLQTGTKSLALTAGRPDTDDLFVFADDKSYETFIDKLHPGAAGAKPAAGFTGVHLGVSKKGPRSEEIHAIYDFGNLTIKSAFNSSPPEWVYAGFATYCQARVCGGNFNFHRTSDTAPIETNFNERVRKNAAKLKKWEDLFKVASPLTYSDETQCYSVVSCLLELDGTRFPKFVQNINAGDDSVAALEKAYGRKLSELETYWKQWFMKQK